MFFYLLFISPCRDWQCLPLEAFSHIPIRTWQQQLLPLQQPPPRFIATRSLTPYARGSATALIHYRVSRTALCLQPPFLLSTWRGTSWLLVRYLQLWTPRLRWPAVLRPYHPAPCLFRQKQALKKIQITSCRASSALWADSIQSRTESEAYLHNNNYKTWSPLGIIKDIDDTDRVRRRPSSESGFT